MQGLRQSWILTRIAGAFMGTVAAAILVTDVYSLSVLSRPSVYELTVPMPCTRAHVDDQAVNGCNPQCYCSRPGLCGAPDCDCRVASELEIAGLAGAP